MAVFLGVLGWICAVIGSGLAVPQVVRLIRAENSAGASLLNWQLVVGSGLAWTVYGMRVGHANVWVPNVLMAAAGLVIIVMICRDRGLNLLKELLIPVAVIAVSLLCWWAGVALWGASVGNAVFGFVVNVPQMVGMAAQLRSILTEPSLAGLSVTYIALVAGVQYLWLLWGLLTPDYGLVAGASALGLLGTLTMLALAARKAGRVGPDRRTAS